MASLIIKALFWSATVFLTTAESKRVRSRNVQKKGERMDCVDPPDLKEKLALWLSESAEGVDPGADWSPNFQDDDDWTPSAAGSDVLCEAPLDTGTDSNVMQRSLCPWTYKVSFDERREPKMLSEASCLCRRSRGSSGSYCMPIKRDQPILKRGSCDPSTGYYEYTRVFLSTTVGCHSVLPRTQRTYKFSQLHYNLGIQV